MTASSDPPGPPPVLGWLAALGDLVRLRILRLLVSRELSVGELARVLQLGQSTVSRHLKRLSEGRWISKRAEGTASLFRMDEASLDPGPRGLWELACGELAASRTAQEDDRRLDGVLAERRADSQAFFGRIGGGWDELRRELFGEVFTTEALLGLVDPDWVVADLGCGTGSAAAFLAPVVRKIIAVDREPALLEAARKRLAGFSNVELRAGEVTAIPIDEGAADAAIVFLVLVYLPRPPEALREIARILRPGGVALIVDMVPHDRESYRHTMGHHHLGLDEQRLKAWAETAGLREVRYRRLRPATSAKGPGLFAATMTKARDG